MRLSAFTNTEPKPLLATDILKALYAPQKVFKKIVQEPKYLAAAIVFILFVAAQVGYYYSYYSHTYYEQSTPSLTQIGLWTTNTTMWQGSSGITITNSSDHIESYGSYYGDTSLQLAISNSSSLSVATMQDALGMVNCGSDGYQNMSLSIEIVAPNAVPESATVTLYSLEDANYFQYDLTPELSNASLLGVWTNLTIPVGHGNWQSTGSPQWTNITNLKLDFSFPSSTSSVTIRLQGVFFRGIYEVPVNSDSTGFLAFVVEQSITLFLFMWLILTGILYIVIKGLKGNVTWKPLFIALGVALIVMVVQSLITIAATVTLPAVLDIPVEYLAMIPGQATAIYNNFIAPVTATFAAITTAVQLAVYAWTVGLAAIIVKALVPEFSWSKSILGSVAAFVVTIIVLAFLGV